MLNRDIIFLKDLIETDLELVEIMDQVYPQGINWGWFLESYYLSNSKCSADSISIKMTGCGGQTMYSEYMVETNRNIYANSQCVHNYLVDSISDKFSQFPILEFVQWVNIRAFMRNMTCKDYVRTFENFGVCINQFNADNLKCYIPAITQVITNGILDFNKYISVSLLNGHMSLTLSLNDILNVFNKTCLKNHDATVFDIVPLFDSISSVQCNRRA